MCLSFCLKDHSHRSSLTRPEHDRATWSIECNLYFQIMKCRFFHLVMKLFSCSVILKSVADFSTALYLNIVCCCLSGFKVNPPLTVTAMSALCACACASVPCRSPPLPTVLCSGTEWNAHTSQTNWILGSNVLRHSTVCLMWVSPKGMLAQSISYPKLV